MCIVGGLKRQMGTRCPSGLSFHAAGLSSTAKKKFQSVHVIAKESGFSSDLINIISEPQQSDYCTDTCIDVGHSEGLYGKERFAQSVQQMSTCTKSSNTVTHHHKPE